MNDSLAKLLQYIEPKIRDIHENRIEVQSLRDVSKTMSELVEIGKNSYLDILDYYDQEFIKKAIKIGKFDTLKVIEKYESCQYILKNRDPNMKNLPQYKDSVDYMDSLFRYLCELNHDIKLEYEKKEEDLKVQELLNKYFILLQKNTIFIKDIPSFLTFLDIIPFDKEDKLNLLIYINKCNIKNYKITDDLMLTNTIGLLDIENLLEENKELISYPVEEKKDFRLDLHSFNEEDLLEQKRYLIHKIKRLYDAKQYDEIPTYYLDFYRMLDYEKELFKQKTTNRKLVFLEKNGKSFVRKYLDNCEEKYKSCIFKNLLDLEIENDLTIPIYCYKGIYIYIKNEFIVKTVYTYLENGSILVIGILDKNTTLEKLLEENKEFLLNISSQKFNETERDLILKNIKVEDLVLTVDLNTLDIKMED